MLDPIILLQIAWTGIAISSYYVLFTIAFSLALKVMQLWNFAQAGLMALAFYAMFFALNRLALPLPLGIAFGVAVTVIAAVALEVFGLRTLRARRSGNLTFFIFTLIAWSGIYDAASDPGLGHDMVGVPGTNTIVRARFVVNGANHDLQVQRITSPGTVAQWTTWPSATRPGGLGQRREKPRRNARAGCRSPPIACRLNWGESRSVTIRPASRQIDP